MRDPGRVLFPSGPHARRWWIRISEGRSKRADWVKSRKVAAWAALMPCATSRREKGPCPDLAPETPRRRNESRRVIGNHRVQDESETVVGGRYQLGSVLGRGGMAEVRRGLDVKLQRAVALKLLRTDLASDSAFRARFEGEARSAARLRHPNVVSIFDTGEDSGVPYIVMELLPGDTLADRIRAGPCTESTVRLLASQVLGALHAAHSAGILHRDVKPANILFDDRDAAKVADFGIAKSMEAGAATELTSVGNVFGTAAYVAPERAEGRAASPASDLWSLGVVLYEALTQQRPFPGDSALATALSAQQGSMIPLSTLRPDLSPQLVAVVERAVAPRPADRFASAAAMAADLGVELGGAGPRHRLDENGPALAAETRRLTAVDTSMSPEIAAIAGSTRPLASEPATSASRPVLRKPPVHRRNRGSRARRGMWLALGTTAAVVLITLIALAASGLLGGSTGPPTTSSSSASHRQAGHASTPSTTLAPPSTPATTVPTAPSTTAVPPSQPATTAGSPASRGHGPHPGHGPPPGHGHGGAKG